VAISGSRANDQPRRRHAEKRVNRRSLGHREVNRLEEIKRASASSMSFICYSARRAEDRSQRAGDLLTGDYVIAWTGGGHNGTRGLQNRWNHGSTSWRREYRYVISRKRGDIKDHRCIYLNYTRVPVSINATQCNTIQPRSIECEGRGLKEQV